MNFYVTIIRVESTGHQSVLAGLANENSVAHTRHGTCNKLRLLLTVLERRTAVHVAKIYYDDYERTRVISMIHIGGAHFFS